MFISIGNENAVIQVHQANWKEEQLLCVVNVSISVYVMKLYNSLLKKKNHICISYIKCTFVAA